MCESVCVYACARLCVCVVPSSPHTHTYTVKTKLTIPISFSPFPLFHVCLKFDLVCDRSALSSLSQTLLMLGQGLGALLFTALSDRYGRKRINIITHALLMAGRVALAFVPDYVTFAIFKLFIGAVQQVSFTTIFECYLVFILNLFIFVCG